MHLLLLIATLMVAVPACRAMRSMPQRQASDSGAAGQDGDTVPKATPMPPYGSASSVGAVRTTGCWTVSVGPEFKFIINNDSWQAVHEARIVYVSSLAVTARDGGRTPSRELRVRAKANLKPGDHFSCEDAQVQGDATIYRLGDGWQLRGTMCADGTVAMCVIDFRDERHRDWALSVWRSLSCKEGTQGQPPSN